MIFFLPSWLLKLPLLIQEKFEQRPLKSTAGSGEQISRVGAWLVSVSCSASFCFILSTPRCGWSSSINFTTQKESSHVDVKEYLDFFPFFLSYKHLKVHFYPQNINQIHFSANQMPRDVYILEFHVLKQAAN